MRKHIVCLFSSWIFIMAPITTLYRGILLNDARERNLLEQKRAFVSYLKTNRQTKQPMHPKLSGVVHAD